MIQGGGGRLFFSQCSEAFGFCIGLAETECLTFAIPDSWAPAKADRGENPPRRPMPGNQVCFDSLSLTDNRMDP